MKEAILNFETRSRRQHTEHINELVLRRDIVNERCLLVGNDEVTVNLNVLDALTKNIIMSNMNNTMIITVNKNANGLGAPVGQKPTKLEKLKGSINNNTIFYLGIGIGNDWLLLAMPRYERGD